MKNGKNTMVKSISWILYLGMIFLFSCKDDDEKIRAELPELEVNGISMSGCVGLYDAVTFNAGGTEYIGLGWEDFSGNNLYFYKYSPMSREWQAIEQLYPGSPRRDAIAFVIGEKAYVGLGRSMIGDRDSKVFDDFFVYDTLTREWEKLSFQFPGKARWGAVAFTIGGKGYVGTGVCKPGVPGEGDYLADFYEFDPQTGWKQISNIYYPRYGATAFVADGYGYVCFGNLYGGLSNQNIQRLDPVSGRWSGQPVCYEDGETKQIVGRAGAQSFVLNKGGKDFAYVFGVGSVPVANEDELESNSTGESEKERSVYVWGYNPQKNVWKREAYSVENYKSFVAHYAFRAGGQGYVMGSSGGTFEASVFRVKN